MTEFLCAGVSSITPWLVQRFWEWIHLFKVPVSSPALFIRLWFNYAKRVFTEAAPSAPFLHQYLANSFSPNCSAQQIFLLVIIPRGWLLLWPSWCPSHFWILMCCCREWNWFKSSGWLLYMQTPQGGDQYSSYSFLLLISVRFLFFFLSHSAIQPCFFPNSRSCLEGVCAESVFSLIVQNNSKFLMLYSLPLLKLDQERFH